MKPNWYTLAAFVAVVAGIVAAHQLHIDDLYKTLLSAALVLLPTLMPAALSKGGAA